MSTYPDTPPDASEYAPRNRAARFTLDESGDQTRERLKEEARMASRARISQDERNLLALRANPDFFKISRAFYLGSDADKAAMVAAAEAVLAAHRERSE